MRLGYRARVFLAAAASAAFAMLIGAVFHSTLLGLAAGACAAAGAASFVSSTVETDIAGIEGRASQSAQQLSQEVVRLSVDRARTAAVLAGMVEGVLAVDAGGRLRLINHAARRMLKLDDSAPGRHYLEAVRHPVIAEQLA